MNRDESSASSITNRRRVSGSRWESAAGGWSTLAIPLQYSRSICRGVEPSGRDRCRRRPHSCRASWYFRGTCTETSTRGSWPLPVAAATPWYCTSETGIPDYTRPVRSHEWIDQRSLALHEAVAAKLEAQPQLVEVARANLQRWLSTNPAAALREWTLVLDGIALPELVALLRSPGDEAAHTSRNVQRVGERENVGSDSTCRVTSLCRSPSRGHVRRAPQSRRLGFIATRVSSAVNTAIPHLV